MPNNWGIKLYLKKCIQIFLLHIQKREFKENIVMIFASTQGNTWFLKKTSVPWNNMLVQATTKQVT